jgi:SAM-dependent methyltransferase
MGRWSQPLARAFVRWLGPAPLARWLEVGCGTGALTAAICDLCEPASVMACDPSQPFVDRARQAVRDARASFIVAGAEALPGRDGGFDRIVSGLVLNFVPDPETALASMRGRLAPAGTLAAYVWDYAEGVEFLRFFWEAAVAADPAAAALDERRRFPLATPAALAALLRGAGFARVTTCPLEISTDFLSFEDYWTPFLLGTGPAPSYVASLDATERARLRDRLERRLPRATDGAIRLRARAWAVRGQAG